MLVVDLLLLDLLEHIVSHFLLFNDLLLQFYLLIVFNLKISLGLLNQTAIELLILLLGLNTQLLSQLDLLVENILDLPAFLLVFLLLLSLLLFVELLTKLLNLTPFIFANIRRQIINFNGSSIVGMALAHLLSAGAAAKLGGALSDLLSLHILVSHAVVEAGHQGVALPHDTVGKGILRGGGILQDLRLVVSHL